MQLGTFRVIAEPGGFGRCHWREARGFRAYRWRRGRGACPRDRQARMDQRERADKIEPTLAAEPIENAEASEPTDPTDRIEPAEPMDRIEPDEPIDRIDPLDPMLKMEPADPGERDEPAGICITIFWQARHQPDISGLVLPRGRIAPGNSRTERHTHMPLCAWHGRAAR
jgi:hypothetical protein